MDKFNDGTLKDPVADLNSFFVKAAGIQERYDFVEDKRGRYQRRRGTNYLSSMGQNRRMVLIIRKFEGEDVAGVEKELAHWP